MMEVVGGSLQVVKNLKVVEENLQQMVGEKLQQMVEVNL